MAATTTENIMDALYAITYYSGQTYTVTRRFQIINEDFENFDTFPLIVVTTGLESNTPLANRVVETEFHPEVHLFMENADADTVQAWQDNMRTAILGNATLLGYTHELFIDSITPYLSPNRKLQRLTFSLTVKFDTTY